MLFLPSCHSFERSCLLPSPQRCAYWLGSMHQLPLASRVSSSRHCTFKTQKLTKALEHLWKTPRAPLEHLGFNLRSNSMIDVSITILTLRFVSEFWDVSSSQRLRLRWIQPNPTPPGLLFHHGVGGNLFVHHIFASFPHLPRLTHAWHTHGWHITQHIT